MSRKTKAESIASCVVVKVKRATKTDKLIYQRQSQICKAFANPVRIQILEMLGERAWYVSELLAGIGHLQAQSLATFSNLEEFRCGQPPAVSESSCLALLAMPEVKNACELIRNVLRKQVDEGRKLVV